MGFTNLSDYVAVVIWQFGIVPKPMGREQQERLPSIAMSEKSHSSANDKETNKLQILLSLSWKCLGNYTECVVESGLYPSEPTGRTEFFY